jgi:hypothetical protein
MPTRTRTKPRAAKSLTHQIKMARLNAYSFRSQNAWAVRESKRMAAAKAAIVDVLPEVPQAPVNDPVQVGRTPPFEPDPCSITHHNHLPAPSLLPLRAQDESVAGLMALASPAPMLVVAISDDDGPGSESEPDHDLNDSPRSPRPPLPPIAPIVVDEQPSAFLSGKVAEQLAEIDYLEERVEAQNEQIKTRDEQISSLVSRNTLLCAQKQNLQAKIARVNREVKKEQEEVAAAEENDKDLRRMIQSKNGELMQHTLYLRKIEEEHANRLAIYARRTSFAENRSAALEAAWPVGVPMP